MLEIAHDSISPLRPNPEVCAHFRKIIKRREDGWSVNKKFPLMSQPPADINVDEVVARIAAKRAARAEEARRAAEEARMQQEAEEREIEEAKEAARKKAEAAEAERKRLEEERREAERQALAKKRELELGRTALLLRGMEQGLVPLDDESSRLLTEATARVNLLDPPESSKAATACWPCRHRRVECVWGE